MITLQLHEEHIEALKNALDWVIRANCLPPETIRDLQWVYGGSISWAEHEHRWCKRVSEKPSVYELEDESYAEARVAADAMSEQLIYTVVKFNGMYYVIFKED